MKFLRQTHLGSTPTKLLTIVDLQGLQVWPYTIIQSNEACILHQLPDEILLLVVKLSCYENPPSAHYTWTRFEEVRSYDSNSILALSQVCRQFKRIAQPLLFNTVCFRDLDQIVPPSIPVLKLHRTLRERVDLHQHCRWVAYFAFIYVQVDSPILLSHISTMTHIMVHSNSSFHVHII
jgi:hypothetical protein